MNKKSLKKSAIFFSALAMVVFISFRQLNDSFAAQNNFSGKIFIQVESKGEAWYVNPLDEKRYYLGRPEDFFNLIKKIGVGIADDDLKKIPVAFREYGGADSDGDGLADVFEEALKTDKSSADTDKDGHNDKTETQNDYDPLSPKTAKNEDLKFAEKNKGKIFIAVENSGQAWYVNPADNKKYYLGRPADAFAIIKKTGQGITNNDLNTIPFGYVNINLITDPPEYSPTPACDNCDNSGGSSNGSAEAAMAGAAKAIRDGNTGEALKYFTPGLQKAVKYTMNFLDKDGKFTLSNMLLSAKLTSSKAEEKIYTAEVYFSLGGYKVKVDYHVKKQEDGKWLLANL